MKIANQRRTNVAVSLTADEHLWLQKQIEKRAHELWRTGGRRPNATLNDWLQAEREIAEEFFRTRFAQNPNRQEPGDPRKPEDKPGLRFAPAESILKGPHRNRLAYEYFL